MGRSEALPLICCTVALFLLSGLGRAFLQPGAALRGAAASNALPRLGTGDQKQDDGRGSLGMLGMTAGTVALISAVAGRAVMASATVCRATAVKKKGVRVVEGKEIPWNLFSPKAPYAAKCVSNEVVTTQTPLVNWATNHCVIRHDKNVPYIEGQSIGVIAPGPDKKGEVPAKLRLYSIASSSPGDDETYETVSLCVKKVVEVEGKGWFKYSNVENDPEYPGVGVYRGVCSNHICNLNPGDDVLLTGPVGAEMLLPEDPEANIVMLATGTGIAPFRSMLRRLFNDKVTKGEFKGLAWLFLGVPFSASLLYDEEWKEMQAQYPDQFRYDYAVSSEEKSEANKINGEMWVQHKAMEYAEELWVALKNKRTHVYMCGLRGMESGLQECFEALAKADGMEWEGFVKQMKSEKRYHVEVY